MRLIDVDKISFRCAYEGDCIASNEKCKNCLYYVCDYEEIQNQPTAYDISKVVAELEEYKSTIYSEAGECWEQYVYLDTAQKIVRKGGVE